VEHIVLVIKMSLRVITLSNASTVSLIFPNTSSKVEHVGLVMSYWLMSSCHNKDISVFVNVKLS